MPYELEDALRPEGAEYSSVANWEPHVVVDGRITGQNSVSAGGVGKELLAALRRWPCDGKSTVNLTSL